MTSQFKSTRVSSDWDEEHFRVLTTSAFPGACVRSTVIVSIVSKVSNESGEEHTRSLHSSEIFYDVESCSIDHVTAERKPFWSVQPRNLLRIDYQIEVGQTLCHIDGTAILRKTCHQFYISLKYLRACTAETFSRGLDSLRWTENRQLIVIRVHQNPSGMAISSFPGRRRRYCRE